MEFQQGNVFFFIIAIGECANYLSDTETVSVSLRDRAILGGFVTPGSMCGLDLRGPDRSFGASVLQFQACYGAALVFPETMLLR